MLQPLRISAPALRNWRHLRATRIGPTMNNHTQLFMAFVAVVTLWGCDTYFGTKEKPPLPGKRVSILDFDRLIEPDSVTASKKILLPAPTPNDSWPQAGGLANHAMHHTKVGQNIREAWSVNIGSGTGDTEWLIVQPILADGRIYTMDAETEVAALNAESGDQIWRVELTPDSEEEGHVGGGLAYEDGKVFVTTGFAQVISLDAKKGNVIWRRNLDVPLRTAPTVRNNRVYVLTLTNKLFALNGSTGETLWTHSGIEEPTNFLGGASPAVDSGVVVVTYSSGEVIALKVENGQQLWTDSVSGGRRINSTTTLSTIRGRPIIDRGLVFVIGNSGLLTAINLRTGRRVWNRNFGGIESPWVAGDFLFLLTNTSELVALSRQTGNIHWVRRLSKWQNPENKTNRIMWTGPILTSDRLIVAGSSGEALSISPYNGQTLGRVEMPGGVTIGPIVARDTLYFLSDDADLVAYR